MHNAAALPAAIRSCHQLAVPLRQLTYRAIHLRWFASFPKATPLYTAKGQASRYVPPGGPAAALYAAFDANTAYHEFNQDFFRQLQTPAGAALANAGGLRPVPTALLATHVSASRLLDLNDANVLKQLGIKSAAVLLAPWKFVANPTSTQILGDAIFADGWFEGLLCPSAQVRGQRCLVLFRHLLLATSSAHFQGFKFNAPRATLADAQLP